MGGSRRKKTIIAIVTIFIVTIILVTFCIWGYNSVTQWLSPTQAKSQEQKDEAPFAAEEFVEVTNVGAPTEDKPIEETYTDETDTDEIISSDHNKIVTYVGSMTLREKICQMLIVTLDSLTKVSRTTVAGTITQGALKEYPVGGIIHFSNNIKNEEQIKLLNSNLQLFANTPMFISVDEEGGRVGRLKTKLAAHSVGPMLSYEDEGPLRATENSKILSAALIEYGFNTDFAPIADVWSNPSNTVIGDRSFSRDFDSAATLVHAAVIGFRESNIVSSLKHFPGHGDTREDSHNGSAYINKTIEELREGEFKPFISGIAAGVDMVMTGHLIVPSIDDLPATISKKIITGILREELGFNGVVITDSLAMGAISSKFTTEDVAVTAVNAGVDILLMPNVEKTVSALTAAVESGEISEARIDESVIRIISLKVLRRIIEL